MANTKPTDTVVKKSVCYEKARDWTNGKLVICVSLVLNYFLRELERNKDSFLKTDPSVVWRNKFWKSKALVPEFLSPHVPWGKIFQFLTTKGLVEDATFFARASCIAYYVVNKVRPTNNVYHVTKSLARYLMGGEFVVPSLQVLKVLSEQQYHKESLLEVDAFLPKRHQFLPQMI